MSVAVAVAVLVGVGVAVGVDVRVGVRVAVLVAVRVGVGVADLTLTGYLLRTVLPSSRWISVAPDLQPDMYTYALFLIVLVI